MLTIKFSVLVNMKHLQTKSIDFSSRVRKDTSTMMGILSLICFTIYDYNKLKLRTAVLEEDFYSRPK